MESSVSGAVVPVEDLRVALAFFVSGLAFEVREWIPTGSGVAVGPAGGGGSVVLVVEAPGYEGIGGDTGILFAAANLLRAMSAFELRGVGYEPVEGGMFGKAAIRFFDPDNNQYGVIER